MFVKPPQLGFGFAPEGKAMAQKEQRHRANLKQLYLDRAKAGICTRCGKAKAPASRLTCEKCAADGVARARAAYLAKHPDAGSVPIGRPYGSFTKPGQKKSRIYQHRRENGLCGRCGEPPAPGKRQCASCALESSARSKTRGDMKPGWCREYHLRKKYGLTAAEWNALFDAQGRCCAICGDSEDTHAKGWHVDHDHATNKVRGILCGRCNAGLGFFVDDDTRLVRAIEYLRKRRLTIVG